MYINKELLLMFNFICRDVEQIILVHDLLIIATVPYIYYDNDNE